jgi:uncharacterized lipoprotein YddW (UPF0748 family)
VADVYRKAKRARPDRLVTAAVFRTKAAADGVCQDWPRWLREGLLDYAIPMAYVRTPQQLREHFGWWKTIDPKLARILPGIGAFQIGKGKPAPQRAALIAEQIDLCRKQGAGGFVLFSLQGIDDATARCLGRTALRGKSPPYRPPARSKP